MFFGILGYSKHIIFSWKSHTFWVTDDFFCDFWWFCWLGLGNPRHIATKTPLEKLNQNLGLADPPPQLGQKTKFFQCAYLKAPLIGLCWSYSCIAYTCISVSRKMSPQTSSFPKWFVAISTRMRLLSSVGQHVIPQITSPTTWFVATHTLVQLLSTVGKHVIFQITSQTEWFASRQCVLTCVSSEFQHHWIICCICYICVASLQCGWACVFSDFQLDWMICCKWYTYVAFLQCVSSCVSSELQLDSCPPPCHLPC